MPTLGPSSGQLRLRGGVAMKVPHEICIAAAALFGNIRTPAALVAGACLPLGFAFAFPTKEDTAQLRALKRLNVLLAFLAVNSELLSVVFATNAINRLHFLAGSNTMADSSVGSVIELITDPQFTQHWLGVYVHFIVGVIGLVGLTGIRTWLAVGPRFGLPVALLTAAGLLRIFSAVNRSVVVTAIYPSSNFFGLVLQYLAVTGANALRGGQHLARDGGRHFPYVCDLLAIALGGMAAFLAAWRARRAGEWVDVFVGTADAKQTFASFDCDRSGYIDKAELRRALSSMGLTLSAAESASVFSRYDLSADGRLDEDEFETLVDELQAVYSRER